MRVRTPPVAFNFFVEDMSRGNVMANAIEITANQARAKLNWAEWEDIQFGKKILIYENGYAHIWATNANPHANDYDPNEPARYYIEPTER